MSLLMSTTGDTKSLQSIVAAENLTLKLYTNSYAPTKADTPASYTECNIAGYAAKTLAGASWNVAAGTATYNAAQTFNFTAAGTVYGYFVVGATSGVLYWAEEWATPATLPSAGGSITLTPSITLN